MKEKITTKLTQAFAPEYLEVIDDSESHRGHAGHSGSGESHFNIIISKNAFEGKSRVARHQMIHDLLKQELAEKIHALSIKFV